MNSGIHVINTYAKDKLAENFQDDILVICCMTEVFKNTVVLEVAKLETLRWAQKLADLAKRLPNFTSIEKQIMAVMHGLAQTISMMVKPPSA